MFLNKENMFFYKSDHSGSSKQNMKTFSQRLKSRWCFRVSAFVCVCERESVCVSVCVRWSAQSL